MVHDILRDRVTSVSGRTRTNAQICWNLSCFLILSDLIRDLSSLLLHKAGSASRDKCGDGSLTGQTARITFGVVDTYTIIRGKYFERLDRIHRGGVGRVEGERKRS